MLRIFTYIRSSTAKCIRVSRIVSQSAISTQETNLNKYIQLIVIELMCKNMIVTSLPKYAMICMTKLNILAVQSSLSERNDVKTLCPNIKKFHKSVFARINF